MLHVTDKLTNEKYLVDGGALLSILPPTPRQRLKGPNEVKLKAANGTNIDCFGQITRTIVIGKQSFDFDFIVADVQSRILGADFLAKNYLAPNHRDANLINLKDYTILPAEHARGFKSVPVNFVSQIDDPYYSLLDKYPEICTPSFTIKDPKHGVKHHIPTSGNPVQSRARRLNPEKLAVAKAELEKLCDLGVCYRGKSEWSSPLLVTTKPNGGWRVCGDYRRLNGQTTDDRYPVRSIQDFTADLHGKSIFSKIDLMKGYHQIPVAEEDVGKTAVITPFGLFIFPRTPFGLKNAGQDFQRLMDAILGDLPRVYVYIDDILVASESVEQHLKDLEAVFKTLSANGLVVQRSKCVLGVPSLEFLGYTVDSTGIAPLPDRVVAIKSTTPPTTVKELQRFLGMVGYYRRFIPKAASHMYHLFEALKGKPKTLEWTSDCQISFDAIKDALASAALLFHPRQGAQLALTTDASNMAVGGVLEQRGPLGWEPLAFYSSKLKPNERLWPPYDRELLGAFKGIRHFRDMIEGRTFTLYTDHQSLVPSLSKKSDPQTARQTYQLSCISEYTTDIRYVQGKANLVADALSRPNEDPSSESLINAVLPSQSAAAASPAPIEASNTSSTEAHKTASAAKLAAATADLNCVVASIGDLGIDWEEVARQQPLDPEFRQLRNNSKSGLNFQSIEVGRFKLLVDISNGPARPYIPFPSRRRVFDVVHGLGHPGVERTRQSMCSKFIWPSIREDSSRWARECLSCQRSKVTKHVTPPIGDFEVPNKRFQHINLDIVTLPISNGFHYLLTAVDRFTRWPIAIPMEDMSAESVLDAFSYGWVQHFGVPSTITTDRGTQFTSDLFKQLTKVWGIQSILTTPYHPEANGLVERFHRRLKEALLALGSESPEDWYWRLPCVLLAIRTTLKPDVGASPAELVYGEGLAVPGEILPSTPASDELLARQRTAALADARLEVARLQPVPTSAHRKPLVHLPQDLQTCTHVFVRRGGVQPCLSTPYVGPYRVISRNQTNFQIEIPGRPNDSVAICRVKPVFVAAENAEDAEPGPLHSPRPPPSPQAPRRRNRRRRSPTASDRDDPESQQVDDSPPPPPRRQDPSWRMESDDEDAASRAGRREEPPADPLNADQYIRDQNPNRVASDDEFFGDNDPPPPLSPMPNRPINDWFSPDPSPPPPPPPPPPPQKVRRKKKMGNPNWAKGGSGVGRRNNKPPNASPDVNTLSQQLLPLVHFPSRLPPRVHLFPGSIKGSFLPAPPPPPPVESQQFESEASQRVVIEPKTRFLPNERRISRRRPDVSALDAILRQHLGIPTASPTLDNSGAGGHNFFPSLSHVEKDFTGSDSNPSQPDESATRYHDTN